MTSTATFADITPVLDAALRHGGVQFKLETKGKAVQWRQRAYRYRKLLFKLSQERNAGIPGYDASTPYDQLRIDITAEGEVVVAPIPPIPDLMDLDGNPIVLERAKPDEDNEDELLDFAATLAGKA